MASALDDIGHWLQQIPGALKQTNQDVANWVGSLPGAVEQLGKDTPHALWDIGQFGAHGGLLGVDVGKKGDPAQNLPADEGEYGGKKYKFTEVKDPYGNVEDYTAQDPSGRIDPSKDPMERRDLNDLANELPSMAGITIGGHGIGDPSRLSDKEYDALTKAASRGNRLAREILVKGHYQAHDAPTLQQDITKMTDPFVKALSNLPNAANAAEAQVAAVTQPYDFSNAEGQVNNILKNQGFAQLAQPSAATSAYVGKLDQIASGNPLTETNPVLQALGVPTIAGALKGLGPAAKAYQKALPNQALLQELLSRIQYQDVYGTGLSSANALQNSPEYLQLLLQSINQQTNFGLGGSLPSVAAAALAAQQSPTSTAQPAGYP